MAVVDGVLDILRVIVLAANDNQILAAAGDEQLTVFIHEAEVTGAQPRFVVLIPLDARLKCRSRRIRIAPIALAHVRTSHPDFAETVRPELPSRLRVNDCDALSDDVAAAAEHAMLVVHAGRGGDLITPECIERNSPDDRTPASLT